MSLAHAIFVTLFFQAVLCQKLMWHSTDSSHLSAVNFSNALNSTVIWAHTRFMFSSAEPIITNRHDTELSVAESNLFHDELRFISWTVLSGF